MEELLTFKPDAKMIINKCDCYENGLNKEPVLMCHVVLGWNFEKFATQDGMPYNSFVEFWGKSIDDCIEQLKKDVEKLK